MLAKTVTRMCQLYLGLEKSITWCSDVQEHLCTDLMDFILEQGNFGCKRQDDKAAKVLTKYRTPLAFLRGMQDRGLYSWPAVQRYPFLKHFAWIYVGVEGAKRYLTPGGMLQLKKDRFENHQRRVLFDQLYGTVRSEKQFRRHRWRLKIRKARSKSNA